jgi:hypothetical protein
MRGGVIKFAIVLYIHLIANAHAEVQLPSQVDLLTAYCTGVHTKRIQRSEEDDPSDLPEVLRFRDSIRSESTAHLERLRNYLLPRVQFLEGNALLVAIQSGTNDVALAEEEISSCLRTNVTCLTEGKFSESCITHCLAKPVVARTIRCDSTNFLPQ